MNLKAVQYHISIFNLGTLMLAIIIWIQITTTLEIVEMCLLRILTSHGKDIVIVTEACP